MGGQRETEREAETVNLDDNTRARAMEDPQTPPVLAGLPWVSPNCSCPAAANTCTVKSHLVSDI